MRWVKELFHNATLSRNDLLLLGLSYGTFTLYFFLLSDRLWFGLLFGSISFVLLPHIQKEGIRRRKKRVLLEFQDFVYLLNSQLKGGKSLENSFVESKNSLYTLYGEDGIFVKSLEKTLYFNKLGIPYEQGFQLLEEEFDLDILGEFAQMVKIARQRGGAFQEILRETNNILSERLETEREIETLMAKQKMEVNILRIVPFVLLLGLKFLYPELILFLTGSLVGLLTFLCSLSLIAIAFWMSNKWMEVIWD